MVNKFSVAVLTALTFVVGAICGAGVMYSTQKSKPNTNIITATKTPEADTSTSVIVVADHKAYKNRSVFLGVKNGWEGAPLKEYIPQAQFWHEKGQEVRLRVGYHPGTCQCGTVSTRFTLPKSDESQNFAHLVMTKSTNGTWIPAVEFNGELVLSDFHKSRGFVLPKK